jgi:hypothetical protein
VFRGAGEVGRACLKLNLGTLEAFDFEWGKFTSLNIILGNSINV